MSATENKMRVLPIKKLIITMSLPMMASMLVQALYNVVDSIFVARIDEAALTAVTLAFPLQNFMIALGSGTGVGMNALLSRSLGEKKFDRSDAAANTTILLTLMNYLVFFIIGVFFVEPFIRTQTNDPLIIEYAVQYLRIICLCSAGIFFQMTFERMLQSTGRTVFSMASQMTGAVINIIFDPIMIFGLFGFPRMGVAGAAVATVMGQIVAASVGLFCNLKKNPDISIKPKLIFSPKADIVKEIYFVGVPSILMMSIGSIMTYAMNLILIGFSTTAAAVFGVYFKLQSFFFMPVFGLNNGIIPIISYNYGAQKKKRMLNTLKYGYLIAFILTAVGFVGFMTIPDKLLLLFDASDQMLEIGVPALRTIAFHYLIAWYCIVTGSLFQALGKAMYSLYVSVARQLVVLLPAAYILAKIGGLQLIWWSFPIAEVMSCIISTTCLMLVYKRIISKIPA